jgi:hypothetical protein
LSLFGQDLVPVFVDDVALKAVLRALRPVSARAAVSG